MEEIAEAYTRPRRDFGRPCNFTTREAGLLVDTSTGHVIDVQPSPELEESYVVRDPVERAVERRDVMSVHEVNTEHIATVVSSVLHVEGGWPKDVNILEAGSKERYRRKVEKDDDFVYRVKALANDVEVAIMENNAVDIYQAYFTGEEVDHSGEPPSAKTLTVFRDPAELSRTAADVSWQGDNSSKLAVAYCELQFQGMVEGTSMSSYVWNVENPTAPELEIVPSAPLWTVEFNPKDPHILLGGAANGLVAFWDVRKGSAAANSTSSVERSHRDPVFAARWVQSKSASECFSASTDGMVHWWDVRKLGEPLDSLRLRIPKGDGTILGGVVLDYDYSMPTKYMVGTEQGVILNCNKKARNPNDRILRTFDGHHGPIYALQRNPFFPKFFLSVGDWSARIWNEDTASAIITTKYHNSYMTNAAWSPTRAGVFLTSKMDGTIDIWDYLHKQNDPTLSLQVSDYDIRALGFHGTGRFVAVGDGEGTTTLLQLSPGLSEMQNQERQTIGAMFDREQKREKMLETRARELKNRSRIQNEMVSSQLDDIADVSEDQLKQAEKEFYDAIRQAEDAEARNSAAGESAVQEY